MKIQLLAATLLASSLPLAHADTKPLLVKSVPTRADAPVLFAPRGWKIEKQISGNLNNDKVADAALVLVESTPAKGSDGNPTARRRALVVLLHEGKGWHRVGFSNILLQGTRDGGAFYGVVETPVNLSIARGVLNVHMDSGSREVTETTHRLRYESKRGGIYLIGLDSVTRDRATGSVTYKTTNYLNGTRRTSTFKANSNKGKVKGSRVSTKPRTLESLRETDRYDD